MAISGKMLDMMLRRFMKAEVSKNARVQIELPNGEMYDFTGMQLLENRLIGDNETHRLVIKCEKPKWSMGKIIGKSIKSEHFGILQFWEFFCQPFGENPFSKNAPKTENEKLKKL